MKKTILLPLLTVFTLICGCNGSISGLQTGQTFEKESEYPEEMLYENDKEIEEKRLKVEIQNIYSESSRIADVMNDPTFASYGRLIFPVDAGYMSGDNLGSLRLTWYTNIRPEKTVEIVNYMKSNADAGETIFYDIYTDEEKTADPDKKDTGLFFFRGEPGAKFAIVNAGGGFAYVGAMHDSFPHALELSRQGYNAFALIYRPGAQTACEDLARAITFIFEHADELAVDTTDYSLWGGSAGGRMSAWLGSYGTERFSESAYPRPAAVIVNYTGLSEVTGREPPTYSAVGTNDGIADWRTMERRIKRIKANGTDAQIEIFDGLSHGFGLGTGTAAEGWLERAVIFWERNMSEPIQEKETLSGIIPDELEYIPERYRRPADHQGTLEKLTYDTWESFSYEQHSQKLTKEAWIYLPYGYSEDQRYNIFYISHGGWSNETTLMGTDRNPTSFKNVVDHAIEDGRMVPMILVYMTYNNTSENDSGDYSLALKLTDNYHNELINDLIPAVESRYSTYASDITKEALMASRDHRGFGGFSMGSVNTWCTFRYAMDCFRYFMPMSGNYTTDGRYMADLVTAQGFGPDDFFIFSASGTEDFAYNAFKAQIMAMGNNAPEMFRFAKSESEGNLSFMEREGYIHDFTATYEYTYNGLCFFWNAQQ